MNVLAIDTTGFSACLAIVKDGKEVLMNKIGSGYVPNKLWSDFPYILPNSHTKFLIKNLEKIKWDEIDAIAVSAGSGIYTCILAGVSVAKTLSQCHNKPLIEIDHILAHVYSTWLERDINDLNFPILVFSASGSHSDFSLLKNKNSYQVISDAAPKQTKGEIEFFMGVGKVFYQVGKRIGLISSTDSGITKLIQAADKGNPCKYNFSKYYKNDLEDLNFFDFMESIEKFVKRKKGKINLNDVAASFQESITQILANKISMLAQINNVKEVHVVGGISESKYLKNKLVQMIKYDNLPFILRYPVKKKYRLDNAAMIGALACYQKKYKIKFKGFNPSITK